MATITAAFVANEPSAIATAIGTAIVADDKVNVIPVSSAQCIVCAFLPWYRVTCETDMR